MNAKVNDDLITCQIPVLIEKRRETLEKIAFYTGYTHRCPSCENVTLRYPASKGLYTRNLILSMDMDELTNLLGNGQLSDSKEAISALIREFYTDFNGNELEVLSELEKYDRSMLQNIDHYECQKGGIKKSYG